MNCSNKYHISDWSVYAILCSYAIKSVVETACIPCKIICQIITNNKGIFFKSVAKLNVIISGFVLFQWLPDPTDLLLHTLQNLQYYAIYVSICL